MKCFGLEVFNNKHVQNTVIKKTFSSVIGEKLFIPNKNSLLGKCTNERKTYFLGSEEHRKYYKHILSI